MVNALNAAVGGNLSAGATQFVQMGVANYLQQEGATLLGKWTHEGKLTEGSPLHAALHGAVGCLGAAAGGGDCGAGGMGAATSSLLTNLFTDQPNETFAEKEAKRDIIVGLTTAMALGTNLDPGTAMNSAFSSLDNNYLTQSQILAWVEAKEKCTSKSECDAVDQYYFALDLAQQKELEADCGSSYELCVEKYGDFFANGESLRTTIREARTQAPLAGMSLTEADSIFIEAIGRHQLEQYTNLDPDTVEVIASVVGSVGRKGRGGRSISSHQTHVQANSGNTNTGRHTEQPNSHTTGNVATSSGGVNKPRTSDNASSVGQNETSNHSGVDGRGDVTKSGSDAVNNATKPLLNRQLSAEQIAKGHAFEKHVLQQGQFPFIKTKEQFADHLESVMNNPTHHKKLGAGREAFYDSKTSTFIVRNPADPDGGSAFQESLDYFNRQN